ncbi:hypothetical protein DYI26_04945 [Halomonas litopenaei]|nr:hypothetical protein [Halomonas litopenaei]
MGIINAFGMNHLIEQLKKRQDEEEIYFYYIKTESHVGEIYFLKDFLIGFQFVERRCEKYIKGCNPDML